MYIKLKIDVFWSNNNSLPIRPLRLFPNGIHSGTKYENIRLCRIQSSDWQVVYRWYQSLEVWPKRVDTLLTKVPVVQTLDSGIQRISIRERPIALSTG